MEPQHIIDALSHLGTAFQNQNDEALQHAIFKAQNENLWFTEASIHHALNQWGQELQPEKLNQWVASEGINTYSSPKTIGLVMAGNIPLVGLHDLLSVMITGNIALIKLSAQDKALMEFVVKTLISAEPQLQEHLLISERLNSCEAIIATGSNNTARYFEYYFKSKPSIIRKNRNSLAVLNGKESDEELHQLGHDIFSYYGLGCRNVTHLLLPNVESRVRFLDGIEQHKEVLNHNKYANNYTYHKALFLMNQQDHLDNNFLLMKEDESLYSPIGCLFYSYYNSASDIQDYIQSRDQELQVIVGDFNSPKTVSFGQSQQPGLTDYADMVNTVAFLHKLN